MIDQNGCPRAPHDFRDPVCPVCGAEDRRFFEEAERDAVLAESARWDETEHCAVCGTALEDECRRCHMIEDGPACYREPEWPGSGVAWPACHAHCPEWSEGSCPARGHLLERELGAVEALGRLFLAFWRVYSYKVRFGRSVQAELSC